MQSIVDTIDHTLQNKLQSLVSFLRQITRGFDAVAEEIDNTNLKTAMIALAVESKQYAKEISNQLQKLNIPVRLEFTDQLWKEIEENISEQAGSTKGAEITVLCNNCEKYFGKLYADVLLEYFPYKNLKDIIKYQLYATEYAFMKIRLLNALRFN
jgi:hypothetical protein